MSTRLVIVVNLPIDLGKFSDLLTALGKIDPKAEVQTKPTKRTVEVDSWLIETAAET